MGTSLLVTQPGMGARPGPADGNARAAPKATQSINTPEAAPGIMVDYDAARNTIGIEVPDARERITQQRSRVACSADVGGVSRGN